MSESVTIPMWVFVLFGVMSVGGFLLSAAWVQDLFGQSWRAMRGQEPFEIDRELDAAWDQRGAHADVVAFFRLAARFVREDRQRAQSTLLRAELAIVQEALAKVERRVEAEAEPEYRAIVRERLASIVPPRSQVPVEVIAVTTPAFTTNRTLQPLQFRADR
jgi:hypothetical protein